MLFEREYYNVLWTIQNISRCWPLWTGRRTVPRGGANWLTLKVREGAGRKPSSVPWFSYKFESFSGSSNSSYSSKFGKMTRGDWEGKGRVRPDPTCWVESSGRLIPRNMFERQINSHVAIEPLRTFHDKSEASGGTKSTTFLSHPCMRPI